nr:6531_t:CDS:2 [Entrophospora candida]
MVDSTSLSSSNRKVHDVLWSRRYLTEVKKLDESNYEDLENMMRSEVWLIGHSLGGSLTLLPGLTYGLPVVAYEAPGERQAVKGLHLSGPKKMETKCHVGKVCVFDVIEKLKWGISLKTHSIKEVIEKILTLWNETYNFAMPECKHEHKCEDCVL